MMESINLALTIFLSAVVGLVAYLYFLVISKDSRIEKFLNQFPGPPLIPLLGNALSLNVPNHELLGVIGKWRTEYGPCYRVWLANLPYIFMCDAESAEKVLTSSVHIEKSKDYKFLFPWLGTGLLTSSGAKWNSRRKLLTPAFHFKILDDFLEVFDEQGNVLVQELEPECGKTTDIFPFITRCALDVICETAMGRQIHAQSQRDSPYVKAIYEVGELVVKRVTLPWFKPDIIWNLLPHGRNEKKLLKILHAFTNEVIEEKKLERRQKQSNIQSQSEKKVNADDDMFMTKKRRLAFLDLLLEVAEDGKVLSDLDIREETDTFMFEGHDTTAANLGWTLLLLASNPECQEKVREELDGIFGQERDRKITTNDLSQMKYLELCIKESLRLFPSVPLFARRIEKDLALDGKTIPAGAQVFICPYYLHRDEECFPEPEEFRPERFLKETKRSPYAYVPFSAGPRNCIGQKFAIMEEKVILSKVIMNFVLEAVDDVKSMLMVPDLILRPKIGIHLKLKRRSVQ